MLVNKSVDLAIHRVSCERQGLGLSLGLGAAVLRCILLLGQGDRLLIQQVGVLLCEVHPLPHQLPVNTCTTSNHI